LLTRSILDLDTMLLSYLSETRIKSKENQLQLKRRSTS
jgi:hypothetical protein